MVPYAVYVTIRQSWPRLPIFLKMVGIAEYDKELRDWKDINWNWECTGKNESPVWCDVRTFQKKWGIPSRPRMGDLQNYKRIGKHYIGFFLNYADDFWVCPPRIKKTLFGTSVKKISSERIKVDLLCTFSIQWIPFLNLKYYTEKKIKILEYMIQTMNHINCTNFINTYFSCVYYNS